MVVNDYGIASDGGGDSDAQPANETVADIVRNGGRAIANFGSVASAVDAERLIEDAVAKFGRIDSVVNNAGILRDRIWHKMSHDDFRQVIEVHLFGTFNVCKAATPFFKEQKSGSFINFTSTSGLIGNFGQANYNAAKMGIVGLTQSIALDMSRFGATANCIAPFAWSRMTESIPAQNDVERQRIERAKSMTADKIAPLIACLASDRAKDVTGQIFCVRKNEIFLFSKPRPIRSMHRSEGWTAESIADDLLPAFRPNFYGLERSGDVFCWDPV